MWRAEVRQNAMASHGGQEWGCLFSGPRAKARPAHAAFWGFSLRGDFRPVHGLGLAGLGYRESA